MAVQNPQAEDPSRAERIGWLMVAFGALVVLADVALFCAHWPVSRQIMLFLNSTGAAIGIAGGRAVDAARRSRRKMRKHTVLVLVLDEKTGSDTPTSA